MTIPCGFNPRTRVGCDERCSRCRGYRTGVSIHAPAWGATLRPCGSWRKTRCFNPRTRVGCDVFPQFMGYGALQFQSTHPRGVRHLNVGTASFNNTVSIHAPAWGATRRPPPARRYRWFQSTHPRGVRRYAAGDGVPYLVFQSTHPRGVRLHARAF